MKDNFKITIIEGRVKTYQKNANFKKCKVHHLGIRQAEFSSKSIKMKDTIK